MKMQAGHLQVLLQVLCREWFSLVSVFLLEQSSRRGLTPDNGYARSQNSDTR